jgi:hypothetical protein
VSYSKGGKEEALRGALRTLRGFLTDSEQKEAISSKNCP